jgi:hypothetical protein
MPQNEKNSKTVTTMQKVMYTAGAIAAIGSAIVGFKTIKKEISDYVHSEVHSAIEHDVNRFEDTIKSITIKIENHIKEKEESFAVGLRMHKDGQLFYRPEDGKEYPAYKDIQISEANNYPYYYYINPTTGQREWCK